MITPWSHLTYPKAHRTQVGRPHPAGEAGDRAGEGPHLQALAPVRGRHAQRQQQHQDIGAEAGRSRVDPTEGGEGQAFEQQPDDGIRVSCLVEKCFMLPDADKEYRHLILISSFLIL